MSTSWSETATEICSDALMHLGVISTGESIGGDELAQALRALDSVLKELPLYGYSWPKLSSETAFTWVSGQTIALPADFYAFPTLWITSSGSKTALTQITHAEWIANPGRSLATGTPSHFYVSPDKYVWLYPTPTSAPTLTLQYQKVIDDAAGSSAPNIPQYWINPLGYGVAHELGLKYYSSTPALHAEIAQRWQAKRDRALESSISMAPISFCVAD